MASSYVTQTTSLQQREHHQSEEHFQIETDLMQRIAQKPYLQAFTSNEQHPRGVPQRLRVLAIDVPEMRTSFDGECRLNLSKVYADGVAPPKEIDDDRAKHEKQKAVDNLQSILFKLPVNRELEYKLERAIYAMNLILQRHIDHMIHAIQEDIKKNGYNHKTKVYYFDDPEGVNPEKGREYLNYN